MKVRKDLFFGESLKEKKRETILSIEKESNKSLYLISPSLCPSDMLDLYPASVVYANPYLKENLDVRGVASDREECIEMVRDLAEKAIATTGDADLRTFITREKGEEDHGNGVVDP